MSALVRLSACIVDLDRSTVARDGKTFAITTKEASLLRYLMEHADRSVDQDELLREVWGYSDGVVTRTVRTTVNRLRTKIERDPKEPDHLVTVYGAGYRFVPPADRAFATNVVAEVDRFFGRDDSLDALDALFESGRRLVTITGPGGIGKTRLAQRYALGRAHRTRRAVWFADLTESRSVEGVVSAVAAALGVELRGKTPAMEQVGAALAGRTDTLLIVDNLEQTLDGAATAILGWLQSAPALRILATSREPLLLRAEALHRLEPLHAEDASALFRDRALARQPRIALRQAAVEAVVRQLDHLPLAVELAASQVGQMTVEALRTHLETHLASLGTRLRDVDARHATLRATIDWSWELLDDNGRRALAQCAVFAGGCTAEAASAVLEVGDTTVLDELVVRSLLRREGDRYRMLESIRAYATEKQTDLEVRTRHARYFATFGEDAARERLMTAGARDRIVALKREAENLVVATRHAVAIADPGLAARCALGAHEALSGMAPTEALVGLLREVLDQPGLADAETLALGVAIGHALRQGWRMADATVALEAALERARAKGDRRWEGRALHGLGLVASESADWALAESLMADAAAAAHEAGDRAMEGRSLGPMGAAVCNQGRLEQSIELLQRAVAIAREVGDRFNEGSSMANLGTPLGRVGRLTDAISVTEGALAIADELRDRRKAAMVGFNLGILYEAQGRSEDVRTLRLRSVEQFGALGLRRYVAMAQGSLATVEARLGNLDASLELYEAAISTFRELGDRWMEAATTGNHGSTLLGMGRPGEARRQYEAAIALYRDAGSARGEGAFLASLAEVLALEGDFDGARTAIDRSERLLREAGDLVELAKALCRKGHVALLVGNVADARAALAEARLASVGLEGEDVQEAMDGLAALL